MLKHAGALCVLTMVSGLWLIGCGESGSQPVIFSEVQFRVQRNCLSGKPCPAQTEFTAELEAGGVSHTFPHSFIATADFRFFLENAAPPYGGRFTIVGDNAYDIEVKLIVTGAPTTQTGDSAGAAVPAIVGSFSGTLPPPAQEVRFDLCVPLLTPGTCFTAADSGIFGQPFQGSVGDAAQTHLLGSPDTQTPSVYFLENAVDSVDGKFTLSPSTGQTLFAQLFINGALKQTESGTGDVIIREDL